MKQGLTHYFTGKTCRYGHIDHRLVSNGRCMECCRLASAAWGRNHRDQQRRRKQTWASANHDHLRQYNQNWTNANRDKKHENDRRWRDSNPDYQSLKAAYDKEYCKLWALKNPDKANARAAKRRAVRLRATPAWLTNNDYREILGYYTDAQKLSEQNGIDHVVDHIVPLQGKDVCGLHVPWNLQTLTKYENASKGNRLVS